MMFVLVEEFPAFLRIFVCLSCDCACLVIKLDLIGDVLQLKAIFCHLYADIHSFNF